jgi:hypothetical protein
MNPAHRLAPAVDFARQVLARGHEGTETHRLATYVVQLSEELDECVRTLRDVEAIDGSEP